MVLSRARTSQAMTITEVKHHLDGREERFECDLLLMGDDVALVRFAFSQDRPYEDGPFRLPTGQIVTLAAFWENRSYLVYRLIDEDGQLIGHRFDVCADVRLGDEIHYTDLLLDVWMPPDGSIHVLDEHEVEAAIADGLISRAQAAHIGETRQYLQANAAHVVHALDVLTAKANVAERAK